MDITPLIPEDRYIIEGYGDGGFRISGARYEGSLLVLPNRVIPWSVTSFDDFNLASLESLKAFDPLPEILLLGCGPKNRFLHSRLRKEIREEFNMIVEAMDSGAACRTYNILMSEDRLVSAALIAID